MECENLWDADKTGLGEKSIALTSAIRKVEKAMT